MEGLQKLKEFLGEELFNELVEENKRDNSGEDMEYISKEYNINELIVTAFRWERSDRGYQFWNQKDLEWRDFICKEPALGKKKCSGITLEVGKKYAQEHWPKNEYIVPICLEDEGDEFYAKTNHDMRTVLNKSEEWKEWMPVKEKKSLVAFVSNNGTRELSRGEIPQINTHQCPHCSNQVTIHWEE